LDLENIITKLLNHKDWRDAQILSVLKEKGSKIINGIAQDILNPGNPGFRIGDKVIHNKNNKELDVYNGEIGVITSIKDKFTYVQFKNKRIEYPHSLLWQLELSYCITCHKSQGSEHEKIIFVIQPSRISTRNLLYTGLTRAKSKILILAPSEQVLIDSIANKEKPRQTSLRWLLEKEN